MPSYKSFCWSLGTTSFRMVEFNRKIEKQLSLLDEFWRLQPSGLPWGGSDAVQRAYYEFLKQKNFIENRNAPRKDKDARQKTSGLVDLGLLDAERRLTDAGRALLAVAESGDFRKNNLLLLPADSFLYFKQLLKVFYRYDDSYVRPYVILAYILSITGEISKREFTYLLPLAINEDKTKRVIEAMQRIKKGVCTIDDVILEFLFEMDNYQEAEEMFLAASEIDEALIQEVGMNRKSKSYDIPYRALYDALQAFREHKTSKNALSLFCAADKLSGRARSYWKMYLFNTISKHRVESEGTKWIHGNRPILTATDERTFRRTFFRLMHLFKAKSVLDDYYDLNKRYFKTTDTLIFQDDKVRLDIMPHCYFSLVKDTLWKIAFTPSENLASDCGLKEIADGLGMDQEHLFRAAQTMYGVKAVKPAEIKEFVEQERYTRFNQMIDAKFKDKDILELLSLFERRCDDEIRKRVTNNADVPTIFEYVIAVAWYKISGRQGKILDYMNLSLDSDLLPITHATGGHEDITYRYEATEAYPAHTLLIEATLAGGTNQRRMEMEPVSRHLGDYLLAHRGEEAYCLFATTYLHINVISDFRMRKRGIYYSTDGTEFVEGMKIVPCQTAEIKTMIMNHLTYAELYALFESAYHSPGITNEWYNEEIKSKLAQ